MPYASDKQRKYFHWAEENGKISPKTVKEYDKASKGKDLPEYAPKKKRFNKLREKMGKKD